MLLPYFIVFEALCAVCFLILTCTVLVDYILLVKRFKRMILAENADLPTQPVIAESK